MRGAAVLGLGLVLVMSTLMPANGPDPAVSRIEGMTVEMVIAPNTFLLEREQSGSVVVHVDIPYSQVDTSSVRLEEIEARGTKPDLCGNLVAFFDEDAVEDIVQPPSAILTLTGYTITGEPFTGSDEVQVKKNDNGKE